MSSEETLAFMSKVSFFRNYRTPQFHCQGSVLGQGTKIWQVPWYMQRGVGGVVFVVVVLIGSMSKNDSLIHSCRRCIFMLFFETGLFI